MLCDMLLTQKQRLGFVLAVLALTRPKNAKRKLWAKKWLMRRKKFTHTMLLKELQADDFRNYLRMDEACFSELLNIVKPYLTKKNTVMREAVSCEERLLATLRFLATGRSYENLKFSAVVSPQLLSKIIPETCNVIYKCLKKYIKMPSSSADWEDVAANFERKWNFSHCVGAMDGKQVAITKPPGSGSLYYNYKQFFSVLLFAVVNADYEFMYVHVGTNGCVSYNSVLQETNFYKQLVSGALNLATSSPLPNSNKNTPYVFVGDNAIALNRHIMTPYPQKNIMKDKEIFNYRLSRVKRVAENAFGILASRFRVLHQTMTVNLEAVDSILLACCVLHNYLLKKNEAYITASSFDREDVVNSTLLPGDWRHLQSLVPLEQCTTWEQNEEGHETREVFMNYFNNEGQLPYQEAMLRSVNEFEKCL